MMAQRPAHCPSAYAHSHIRVCVWVCAQAGFVILIKSNPPSQSPSEKDSREHEPLSGWPRWGHRIRVTWIYRPNMTAKLWSPVWDVSRWQSFGLILMQMMSGLDRMWMRLVTLSKGLSPTTWQWFLAQLKMKWIRHLTFKPGNQNQK